MIFDHPSTEQVVLDRIRIGASQRVSPYILHNMEVSEYIDHLTNSMVVRFESDVLAKTLERRRASSAVTFDRPASTWQMFKHSHREGRWLGWLARRWPVRMETETKFAHFEMKANVAFPDCTYVLPKELGNPRMFWTVDAR